MSDPETSFIVEDQPKQNFTLDEIAEKVAELALIKVLAKLEQLSKDDES